VERSFGRCAGEVGHHTLRRQGGDLIEQRTLNFNSTRRSEYEAGGNADHRRERRDAARFWGELPLDPALASGTTGLSRGHDKTYWGDPIDILTQPRWVHLQTIQKTPGEPLSRNARKCWRSRLVLSLYRKQLIVV
jgi:hypothetical protein